MSCSDIDECDENKHSCRTKSFCINVPGSYQCSGCTIGYHLDNISHCIDVNECEDKSDDCYNSVCENKIKTSVLTIPTTAAAIAAIVKTRLDLFGVDANADTLGVTRTGLFVMVGSTLC
ncbi:hypothetical protein RRG08_047491 [Elysia crispata]|uniref:EGF-like calcium-binding domain-containing protein n=1 Tax=Elysia crispata TaxID=231223 RepID=A0AAE0Z8N0_9GAST|nr:hypothetical protein RRG08_047491 [Elysia crispata]